MTAILRVNIRQLAQRTELQAPRPSLPALARPTSLALNALEQVTGRHNGRVHTDTSLHAS